MAIDPSSNTQVQLKQGGNELAVGPTGAVSVDAAATVSGLAKAGGAIVALTDNSGGAAADGTIGAVTAPTALTHAVGTADNTVDDVGGSFNQTTLNNNFKELTTAQAANRLAIVALTDAVKEIAAKVNAIITALQASGALS